MCGCSLLEAYTVGTIVTFYDTVIVLEALLITVGLFLGLTLFTLQSKWDFSGMGPFLFGGLWALILAGFIMLFFPHNGYLSITYLLHKCTKNTNSFLELWKLYIPLLEL